MLQSCVRASLEWLQHTLFPSALCNCKYTHALTLHHEMVTTSIFTVHDDCIQSANSHLIVFIQQCVYMLRLHAPCAATASVANSLMLSAYVGTVSSNEALLHCVLA